MNKTVICAIALAAIATTPLVNAGNVYTAVWSPGPGAYALMPALDFVIQANPGDVITTTLNYASDLPVDMGLRVLAPGQSCTILNPSDPPGTDVPCLAGQTVNTCPPTNPDPIATATAGTITRSVVVTTGGTHKVSIAAELNAAARIFLTLDITVNGETPVVGPPTPTNYVNRGVVCKPLP